MFKIDHNVNLIVADSEGTKETITGVIHSFDTESITIHHYEGGLATFPMEEVVKSSVGAKATTYVSPVRKKSTSQTIKPKGGVTKQSLVNDLYSKNRSLSRQEYIQLIMNTIPYTSKASASTMIANAKRQIGSN